MSSVKKACLCAICIALCGVLPAAFHALAVGAAFSPIHLPVLLCGLVCGWPYGAFCGVAGPVISCLITGMPSPLQLLYMIPELCVYGLVTGVLFRYVRTGRTYLDACLSLIPAMLLGRIAGGAAQAAFYLSTAREYSLALWVGGYLIGTLPGAVLQIVALPVLVSVLMKAGTVPPRYSKEGARV